MNEDGAEIEIKLEKTDKENIIKFSINDSRGVSLI